MDVDARALYVISVAAELAGVHPQTLRIYERKGLLAPARTSGRSRRYSDRDIALLRRIQELTNEGMSLLGVQRILALEEELESARERAARREAPRRPGRGAPAARPRAGGGGRPPSGASRPAANAAPPNPWSPRRPMPPGGAAAAPGGPGPRGRRCPTARKRNRARRRAC